MAYTFTALYRHSYTATVFFSLVINPPSAAIPALFPSHFCVRVRHVGQAGPVLAEQESPFRKDGAFGLLVSDVAQPVHLRIPHVGFIVAALAASRNDEGAVAERQVRPNPVPNFKARRRDDSF